MTTYDGLKVECGRPGEDYAAGRTVPLRDDTRTSVAVNVLRLNLALDRS
ncbi:hypothetical protein [Nonomuraea cavernae]